MKVAPDIGELEQLRRLAAEAGFAQLGRHERDPERAKDALLVGRVWQRLQRGRPFGRARRPDELGAEALRRGDDELDRHAFYRDAECPALVPFDDRDDLRECLEAVEHVVRMRRPADDGESLRGIDPAARVAGRHAAQRVRDRLHERSAAVEGQRPRCCRLGLARKCGPELALGLRPDAGHLLEPARGRRLPQLVECADAEHAADLEHPPDGDAEEAPEPGELRRDLALELLQLRDLAGFDQLSEPALDSRPDPTQLAHSALPDEVGDRRRRGADQVGCPPVGPRGVGPGARQLQERRERVQPRCDRGVVQP